MGMTTAAVEIGHGLPDAGIVAGAPQLGSLGAGLAPRRRPWVGGWIEWRVAPERARPGVSRVGRGRRLAHSGRAVVLWLLGLYALSQFAMNTIMDRWHPEEFDTVWRSKHEQLRALVAHEPDAALVAMVGSCGTDGAFQAGRLRGLPGPDGRRLLAYNLGVPAAGPLREWLYLRTCLDDGIRPRLLLVEFLPLLFNAPRGPLVSEEAWTEPRWLSLSQVLHLWPYFRRPRQKGDAWLETCLAPVYTFRHDVHGSLFRLLNPMPPPRRGTFDRDDWGFAASRPVSAEDRAFLLQCAFNQVAATLSDLRLGRGLPGRATCSTAAGPSTSAWRWWSCPSRACCALYSPRTLARLQQFRAELRAAYDLDIIDANCWLPDKDFADGHHLLVEGADAFTTRLGAEIQRLLR